MISSRHLSALPEIPKLIRLGQALATLDAILCPEWEYRYFSFNNDWDPSERLGLMRNGEGDDFLMLANDSGLIIKGFVHDSPMAAGAPWPGVMDAVPDVFESFLNEPAFSREATTFCVWRLHQGDGWHKGDVEYPSGDDPDGSEKLLAFLDGHPETYKAWGDEYFGQSLNLAAVERIYRHVPLNPPLVAALNPETDYRELCGEIEEIGYPIG